MMFLTSVKLFKNSSLSKDKSKFEEILDFISQEHLTFLFSLLYSTNSQFSSHKDKLFINSFLLSFNGISVPLSEVDITHISL